MVLVLLGTQQQQFTRIIDYAINSNEMKNEQIIIQTGHTIYNKNYDNDRIKLIDFLTKDELNEYMQTASYIITHGGVGMIFNSLSKLKKVLIVPRLSEFEEHADNHQLEISKKLYELEYVCFYNFSNEKIDFNTQVDNFDKKIIELKNTEFKKYESSNKYIEILKNQIDIYLNT